MNYFDFYELKPDFYIDLNLLKSKFLSASRKYHPDHFALQSPEAQLQSDEMSAFNNRAYKTLSRPDTRLKYILELHELIQDEEVCVSSF